VEYLQAVRTLAEIALASTTTIDEFSTSISKAKGFSSDLDKPLQRMQSASLILSGNRGIYKHWLDEVNELDPSSKQQVFGQYLTSIPSS